MSGVEVNRLNLVTKVAVITSSSTRRENHSLPQASQVCFELLIVVLCFVVNYGMTNIRPIWLLWFFQCLYEPVPTFIQYSNRVDF